MLKQTTTATLLIVLASALPATLLAADNRISADIESMDVMHNGQTVTIQRGHDRDAILPAMFQKTDRGCPPFCVQPIVALPGVGTIGELEMLDYLNRKSKGDDSILVVDSRTPDWVMRGTIPGAMNIPWNKISSDAAGTFETPEQADSFRQILADEFDGRFDARRTPGTSPAPRPSSSSATASGAGSLPRISRPWSVSATRCTSSSGIAAACRTGSASA